MTNAGRSIPQCKVLPSPSRCRVVLLSRRRERIERASLWRHYQIPPFILAFKNRRILSPFPSVTRPPRRVGRGDRGEGAPSHWGRTRQPGLKHWYRLNPDLMQKRIVTGGPWTVLCTRWPNGRPLPCLRGGPTVRAAFPHVSRFLRAPRPRPAFPPAAAPATRLPAWSGTARPPSPRASARRPGGCGSQRCPAPVRWSAW